MVCAEPDWGSFFVDDDDAASVQEVCREWTKSIRNPFIGRELPRLLKSAGLTDIKTSGYLLATYGLRDVNLVFDLKKTSEIVSEKNCNDSFNNWYKKLALRELGTTSFRRRHTHYSSRVEGVSLPVDRQDRDLAI